MDAEWLVELINLNPKLDYRKFSLFCVSFNRNLILVSKIGGNLNGLMFI